MLFLAVVALVAAATMRGRPLAPGEAPTAVLDRFRSDQTPERTIDLAEYDGHPELLDPKLALPAWHRAPREQAVAVVNATSACSLAIGPPLRDPALIKAYAFARARCEHEPLDSFVTSEPFMHPSGKSYAALAGKTGPDFARFRHVVERMDLPLSARDWVAIAKGDRVVLGSSHLIVVEPAKGAPRLVLYDRARWEKAARSGAVALSARDKAAEARGAATCATPATSELCWVRLDPRQRVVDGVTIASASIAALAGGFLAFAFVRERRRAAADRLHVFRTLTHELRTPAQSLGLDIELLQASYDELPPSAQESVLRVSEGIARLHRVIHRSARYLQLFDGTGSIVRLERRESMRELMDDFASEWPEGVTMKPMAEEAGDARAGDAPVTTDPEWLSVALRNLVENACKHGRPPVEVTWKIDARAVEIVVKDAGSSPRGLSRRAAYHRGTDGESKKGLGLGLAIVQRIAERLGGTLTHAPEPTTWTLRLPNVAKEAS